MSAGLIVFLLALLGVGLLVPAGALIAVRALIAHRGERPPAWWAVVAASALLVLVPAAAVVGYVLLPVPVAEITLTNSIERRTGSAGFDSECARVVDGRWRCRVSDASGSGYATYAVEAGGWCWDARLTSEDAEAPMPERRDGCARLRDVLGILR